jgi:hypothetical protein
VAKELLDGLKGREAGNFGNALRAMAFRELVFRGDNYNTSFSKEHFVEWSYNYDSYLSELHRIAGQFSNAMKREGTSP